MTNTKPTMIDIDTLRDANVMSKTADELMRHGQHLKGVAALYANGCDYDDLHQEVIHTIENAVTSLIELHGESEFEIMVGEIIAEMRARPQ